MDENKNQFNIGGSGAGNNPYRQPSPSTPQSRPPLTQEEIERRKRIARLRELGGAPSQSGAPRPRTAQVAPQRPAQATSQRPAQATSQRPAQATSQRPAQTTAQRSVQTTAQRPAQGTAEINRGQLQAGAVPTATETEKRQSTVQGVARQTGHTLPSKTAVALEDEDGELIPTGRKKTVAERPAPSNRTYNPQQRTVREAAAPAGREISSLPRHTEKKEDAPHKKDSPSAPWSKKKEKAEQKAETKDKKKNKVKSGEVGADVMANVTKALIYMVIVTAISVLLAVIVIRVGNDIFAFVKGTDEITVTIPEEAGVAQVADILGDNGIINYPSIFKLYCSLKKERGDFLAGEYTVTPSMSYERLRNEFKEQPVTGTCWVTIPEGYTVDDIIDLMVENKIGTREKYIEVINTYDFDFWFIDELEEKGVSSDRSYRLEGYLFPDTYEFYNSSSEEMVIKKLLKRFEEVYGNDFKAKAEEKGYTTDQVLTIASYIQKEAKNTGDYMYVSSVIDNRLKSASFPHLELDATIIYAIRLDTGEKKTSVSHEDTEYNSPYNTYICNGLTPGPITNPGANAIRFALYPTESTYYYYVSDNYGKIYFASNEAEHNRNIETVRKINES